MSDFQPATLKNPLGALRLGLIALLPPLFMLGACSSGEAPTATSGTSSEESAKLLEGLGYAGGEEPVEAALTGLATSEPAKKPTTKPVAESNLPAGHSADDGHDHGVQTPRLADRGVDEVMPPKVLDHDDGPRLTYKLNQEKHEFGRLMQGAVAHHTFELANTGTEDLIVKQVKPTCGCTVAEVFVESDAGEMERYTFGEPIAVGRRIQFPAKLHTANKSGHQNVRINIFSNDPRGTIQLGLVADIDPFFNIAPRFLNFGQVQVGEIVVKKATLSSSKGQALMLEMDDASLPAGASTELVPVNPDAEGRAARWDLTVTVGPDAAEGNLSRSLSVTSDVPIPGADVGLDGKVPSYQASIMISAQVVGPFTFSPAYLSMGLVRPGQVQVRTLRIECHDDSFSFASGAPEVTVVGLQNPGTDTFREWEYSGFFTPTLRPVTGKNAIDIELRLEGLPDDAAGSFRGTLLINLDHPDKSRISLVITGVCRGGPVK
ncbi:MAG: DUF1573 domain-containing protein [bacterium]|jgi:hypothetical protein|nr:DUF1573 domain-containing protein [Planctomycetota bacterium]HIL53233.1 DUF1573 domain-containing protein [Planctomycetota bacterium]